MDAAPALTMRTHLPTGRPAVIVRVDNFQTPVSIESVRYILVVASEKPAVELGIKTARAWVDAGARYICAWGPDSEQAHASFDYAGFLPEYGEEVELVTTAHRDEPIEEALWFAFNCAKAVELESELNAVVIVVDSHALEVRCRFWLENNKD
jgi:hypothetical protein